MEGNCLRGDIPSRKSRLLMKIRKQSQGIQTPPLNFNIEEHYFHSNKLYYFK